ncbi:hypothetical protein NQ315_001148 [Exocentrus adspersus]|uniref:Uncharacterized protein n=1 Tax=Exocentrus adspersus TaxID=1586481 RepID=A0AAV8WEJ4_9CUCU|nr:hypothetical protein NQ315_001148 [Exocentrus adspersus]
MLLYLTYIWAAFSYRERAGRGVGVSVRVPRTYKVLTDAADAYSVGAAGSTHTVSEGALPPGVAGSFQRAVASARPIFEPDKPHSEEREN